MPKLEFFDDGLDERIGGLIRTRRIHLGLSQAQLAERIGMSFQQVQKYEAGSNRISSSMLLRVAQALYCDPNYLLGVDNDPKFHQEWLGRLAADTDVSNLFARFFEVNSPKLRSQIMFTLDALLMKGEEGDAVEKTSPPPERTRKRKAQRAPT